METTHILNICIGIIALIGKEMDVAAEMVTIRNLQKRFIRTSNWRHISGFKPIDYTIITGLSEN